MDSIYDSSIQPFLPAEEICIDTRLDNLVSKCNTLTQYIINHCTVEH